MELRVEINKYPLKAPFTIARHTSYDIQVVTVTLAEGDVTAKGEASAIDYHGETPESLVEQIEAIRDEIEEGISRETLQTLLPLGGARNAVDCAFWDLEAKKTGRRVWDILRITPKPLITSYTLSIDTPERMAKAAVAASSQPLLKIKLNSEHPIVCVKAIRHARPDATLIADANGAMTIDQLSEVTTELQKLGIAMIEQPLPEGKDHELINFNSPIPLCADESCNSVIDLDHIEGRYQLINIKLDKTGGLTQALELAKAAQSHGLNLMVGSMIGTSLGMAPGFIIGQSCQFVDLDGPLLLAEDCVEGIDYQEGTMYMPKAELWG